MDENKNFDDFELEEEFEEPEIVELDGEPFEIIDAITVDNRTYVALVKYNEDDSDDVTDEDDSFIVLEEVEKDGEFFLATIDDENLYQEIGNEFISRFTSYFTEEVE
jgi:hypothetical protein